MVMSREKEHLKKKKIKSYKFVWIFMINEIPFFCSLKNGEIFRNISILMGGSTKNVFNFIRKITFHSFVT